MHKDDHHMMGPQDVNAPARRLSTMTSPAVGARWGDAPPARWGYTPPPDKVHHHAGRQCTSTKAVHKDDHHKLGPQGVNAPARRLSTMTSIAVRACPAPVHPQRQTHGAPSSRASMHQHEAVHKDDHHKMGPQRLPALKGG